MGILCFLFLCLWPSVVPNQRQLSIVVSDWESYLGSLFPTNVVGNYLYSVSVCVCHGCVAVFVKVSLGLKDVELHARCALAHL